MLCVNWIPFDLSNIYLVRWCVYVYLQAHVLIKSDTFQANDIWRSKCIGCLYRYRYYTLC